MISRIKKVFGLYTEPKYWLVGDHKVYAYEVKIPGTEADGDTSGYTARRKTKYECKHCEKSFFSREKFKNEECYEVTYE